jgi:hypothetical protein
MEFRDSFSLTERNPTDFGVQTIRLECYRGSLSDPKWVDQDRCQFLPFFPRVLALTWIVAASFSTLCTIRADLSEAVEDLVKKKRASGQVYYQLDYDVIVLFGLTELKAYLSWKSQVSHDAILRSVF